MTSSFAQSWGRRRRVVVAVLPAALGLGAALAYGLELRPRMRGWGATIVERTRTLPGDELVPAAGVEITQAVRIAAPAEVAWPSVERIGGRARAPAVHVLEPGRALFVPGWGAFVVEPDGPEECRLIARLRVPEGSESRRYAACRELPQFLARRRLLLGVKAEAENAGSP